MVVLTCFLVACNLLSSSVGNESPTFRSMPKDAICFEGGAAYYEMEVYGRPAPSWEVYRYNKLVQIHNGQCENRYALKYEKGKGTLLIKEAYRSDSGLFEFYITNFVGAKMVTASLKVIEKPQI